MAFTWYLSDRAASDRASIAVHVHAGEGLEVQGVQLVADLGEAAGSRRA